MGRFSSKTNNRGSKWRVHVRVTKGWRSSEYNDFVETFQHVATPEEIKQATIEKIVRREPHLNGGYLTRCSIRRVR